MGEGSERIAANRASEDNEPGSCEANDVSSSPQEDCSVSESAVGENKGAAEKSRLEGRAGAMEMHNVPLRGIKSRP
jgi:hypothetical protein